MLVERWQPEDIVVQGLVEAAEDCSTAMENFGDDDGAGGEIVINSKYHG